MSRGRKKPKIGGSCCKTVKKKRGIRYPLALAIAIGLTVGCQLVNIPIAYFVAGVIVSMLIAALGMYDVVRGWIERGSVR